LSLVLVTGGAGFIGSHTVDLLLDRGYDVRIVDSLQPRVHPRGMPDYVPKEVECIIGDVSDPATMARALAGAEAVFHLAAYQDYLPDFSTFIHTNSESTALIFELIVSDPARYPVGKVIVASSQAVSGEGKYRCLRDGTIFYPASRTLEQLEYGHWDIVCADCGGPAEPLLIDEATCNNSHTAYGISKYATELLAFNLGRRYGIATAAMRYACAQGPRNSFFNAYSGIARRFALRIQGGLPPICYEDGTQRRDYVNVFDVVRANLIALEHPEANSVALNVGGEQPVTVSEFARIMLSEAQSDLEPEIPGVFRLGDTRHTVSDTRRMRSLGWHPTFSVEENVGQYLEWLDTQQSTDDYVREAERVMADQGVVQQVQKAMDLRRPTTRSRLPVGHPSEGLSHPFLFTSSGGSATTGAKGHDEPELPFPGAMTLAAGLMTENTAARFARRYLDDLNSILSELPEDEVAAVIDLLWSAYEKGQQVFIMGNGGSASTASHMACDLGKTILPHPDAKRFRVTSLTDNIALITAIVNDFGYQHTFSEQLRNLCQPGDIVVAITCSGDSPNIIEGIETAHELGATTIGFLGFDGGRAKDLLHQSVLVPSTTYGFVEGTHMILGHLITAYLREAISARRTLQT
jgi:dTDP-L-rhamnose 4-epimerase